jgi:hypothetical protein
LFLLAFMPLREFSYLRHAGPFASALDLVSLNANHSVKQTQAEREQTMADHSHDHSGLNRRSVLKAGISLGAAATLGDALAAQSPALTADMAKSVESWLVMLSDTQRRAGQLPWSEARENWHYVPRSRPGLPLREMNDQQKQAVWDVLGALLSARGLDHVRGALILEKILGEMTGGPISVIPAIMRWWFSAIPRQRIRGPGAWRATICP